MSHTDQMSLREDVLELFMRLTPLQWCSSHILHRNFPFMISTLAMLKMSTVSWHIFLKMLKCSLFVDIVKQSLMLHFSPNFWTNASLHMNVEDQKEHLVVVAMVVDVELSAAREP